jgi:hypothetical protein
VIISVNFIEPINGGPFAGGVDSWSRLKHLTEARELPVECAKTPSGVVLTWTPRLGGLAGRLHTLTVPLANIAQMLEVEDAAEKPKK